MGQTIKELRVAAGLTQQQASDLTDIPLRTYKAYENDSKKIGTIKYNYIVDILKKETLIDETHGVLTIESIKKNCALVLSKYDVEYAILFGSYAKGEADDSSDVDIVISTNVTGIKFFGLVEDLRNTLNKKIDLLSLSQLDNNPELLHEVLKDGIRVYEK